jgi:hypothetical protein
MYASGLQKIVLLRETLLNNVSVKMIGVSDKAPWRSVCDLSPKTINPTSMPLEAMQNLSLAGSQASPL